MCGIAGIRQQGELQAEFVTAATRVLTHRGPDAVGTYMQGDTALGMTRLAIIDLESGDQPMFSPKGDVAIVFNGEIYNYRELRAQLELEYEFKTTSDTEVILYGFLKWGTDVFARLNGIFAIALHDERTSELVLARDPVGVKPLYYHAQDNMFVFGSELKVFTQTRVANTVSREGLVQLLMSGYAFHPYTALRDVKQLVPGHFLKVNKSLEIDVRMFRRFPAVHGHHDHTEEEWIGRIDEALAQGDTPSNRQ